jgi:broad specificity phosphatase PhoE
MNIFIVRHGATEWNEKDLVQGNIDLSLSEKGKKAVEKTA